MSGVRWVVVKDLRRFAADRVGAALTVVMPVVLGALFGLLLHPPDQPRPVHVLVVDQDGTPAARAWVAAATAHPSLRVEEVADPEAARARVATGESAVALVLPPDVGAALSPTALLSGTKRRVAVVQDPSRQAETGLVAGLLQKITLEQLAAGLGDAAAARRALDGLAVAARVAPVPGEREAWLRWIAASRALLDSVQASSPDGAALGAALGAGLEGALPLAFDATEVTSDRPEAGYVSYAHTFAGMLCMFLLFWSLEAARELARERADGSLLRVRLAPQPLWHALVGRFVSALLVALLISACVYAVAIGGFGVRVDGSWVGFGLVLVAQAAFAAGFALLLAGVAYTERQVTNVAVFSNLLLSFLGGAWIPLFVFPEWLQTGARVLPTTWATEGLAAMTWRGLPLEHALAPTLVLLGAAAACALIGGRLFRWT